MESIREEVLKIVDSPALQKEEQKNFSKYDYLKQLTSQLYNKLEHTESYSILVNIVQQLLLTSNSKEQ
jgi:hypothetical protein